MLLLPRRLQNLSDHGIIGDVLIRDTSVSIWIIGIDTVFTLDEVNKYTEDRFYTELSSFIVHNCFYADGNIKSDCENIITKFRDLEIRGYLLQSISDWLKVDEKKVDQTVSYSCDLVSLFYTGGL